MRAGGHVLGLDPGTAAIRTVLIDCGPRVPGALYAQEPVAVFEVLPKSTGWIDQSLKLCDYDADTEHSHLCPDQSGRAQGVPTRELRTDSSASRALFFSRAWMRLSKSPSSAWCCRFPPCTRVWNSLPIRPLRPNRRRPVTIPLRRPTSCDLGVL